MIAGLNRKRKNAVDKEVPDDPEISDRKVGRPSKGGESLRSKRYYVKNHLLILQKRKVRRYVYKVKKIIASNSYNAEAVKDELDKACIAYRTRDDKDATHESILGAANLGREDSYLIFLNQEADKALKIESSELTKSQILETFVKMANKHTFRLFQLSTYWSAFLLLRYAKTQLSDEDKSIEKLEKLCSDLYEISYNHLTGEELPEGFTERPCLDDNKNLTDLPSN